MVSEKVIVVLIVLAILLSAVSIVVTISSINTEMIPEVQIKENTIPDSGTGKVSLVVNKLEDYQR